MNADEEEKRAQMTLVTANNGLEETIVKCEELDHSQDAAVLSLERQEDGPSVARNGEGVQEGLISVGAAFLDRMSRKTVTPEKETAYFEGTVQGRFGESHHGNGSECSDSAYTSTTDPASLVTTGEAEVGINQIPHGADTAIVPESEPQACDAAEVDDHCESETALTTAVLEIPLHSRRNGCKGWLLNNTYFGNIVEINVRYDAMVAEVVFLDSDAAHLYAGLLRFAGPSLCGFDEYFDSIDMVDNRVYLRSRTDLNGSRTVLLHCANSSTLATAIQEKWSMYFASSCTTMSRLSSKILFICCESILCAASFATEIQTHPDLWASMGVSTWEFGPDPSSTDYEDLKLLPVDSNTPPETLHRLKILQALARPQQWAQQGEIVPRTRPEPVIRPVSPVTEDVPPMRPIAGSASACNCFESFRSNSGNRQLFKSRLLASQQADLGQTELSQSKVTELCSCGLWGIRRGTGKKSFFVPYIPIEDRMALLRVVHRRGDTHASSTATLSRAQGLTYWGPSNNADWEAMAKKAIEHCPCQVKSKDTLNTAGKRSLESNSASQSYQSWRRKYSRHGDDASSREGSRPGRASTSPSAPSSLANSCPWLVGEDSRGRLSPPRGPRS